MAKKKGPGIKTAGIRELRAKLSQYVRDVEHGEMVQVTDRGQVVACLVSPEMLAEVADLTRVERERRQLLSDGVFSRLGTQEKSIPPLPKRGFSRAEVDAALDWTREDKE